VSAERGAGARHSSLERLVASILRTAASGNRAVLRAWRRPREDLMHVARRDYVRHVRKHLGYNQLLEMIALAEPVWPGFNERRLSAQPLRKFGKMAEHLAENLDVHLQARRYEGPEGMALRGFYVEPQRSDLKRPLIFVNTAHHPGAVSTTFCHEIGHHLTAGFFAHAPKPVQFFFDAAYASHLDQPAELAADAMCAIAGYPHPIAAEIFSAPRDWALVAKVDKLPDDVFNRVLCHITGRYGLDLASTIPIVQRLNYLAGMVHYAKLRWALLEEYDL